MNVTDLFTKLAKQLLETCERDTLSELLDQIEAGVFFANTPLHFFGYHLNEEMEEAAINDTFLEMVKDIEDAD